MKRIAVEIPVNVPLNVLASFVRNAADEKCLAQAYYKMRGTTSPSHVVEAGERRVVIYEPSFDPALKAHGTFRTGWTITYDLEPLSDTETMVEVAVEYNRLTALTGFGLIKPQAENEIIHRISALLAFEEGYNAERTTPQRAPEQPLLNEMAAEPVTLNREQGVSDTVKHEGRGR